jgi:hypothetical protein
MDNNEVDEVVQGLIDDGCFTDQGDTFGVDWELLEILHPAIYEALWAEHTREVDQALDNLVESGLLDTGFQQTDEGGLETIYMLTEAGKAYVEGMGPRG